MNGVFLVTKDIELGFISRNTITIVGSAQERQSVSGTGVKILRDPAG